jgi:hypothetical protein
MEDDGIEHYAIHRPAPKAVIIASNIFSVRCQRLGRRGIADIVISGKNYLRMLRGTEL